jgi:lipid-A-disaccharide synthase-like uncharacterized protein
MLCTLSIIAVLTIASPGAAPVQLKVLPAQVREAQLIKQTDGSYAYLITQSDGLTQTLTPQQFAKRLYVDAAARPWYHKVMNVYTPIGMAWVAMGLLGQVLFTGRMIVQWLVSEKKGESTVPVAFWWMSLIGATMLITYFIWRQDMVGILGQGAGWLIYVRNLRLIYREPNSDDQ